MTHGTIASRALYQEVAERLRQRILSHSLAPGAWIDEQTLAETYGISRTPLREALKVLAAEGLVTLKPRRGCYVAELSELDLEKILPILALLEGRCAFEATEKASDEDLQRLETIHEELEQHARDNEIDSFFETNQAFHQAMQEITDNRWLVQVINDMRKVMKLTRHSSLFLEGRLRESLAEHRAIMKALRARDPARAERSMRDHLMRGREAMTKLRAAARREGAPEPNSKDH